MSKVSSEKLKSKIHLILEDADLTVMTAKKVRLLLEKMLDCDFTDRRKEIDSIVMDFVNAQEHKDSKDEDEDDDDDDDDNDNDNDKEDEQKLEQKKKYQTKSKRESSVDSDVDEKPNRKRAASSKAKYESEEKRRKSAKKADGEKTKRRGGTGFTRAYTLSPELANLMGADTLPRHEVVKKMWAMIKERNLYDPKNKQYAICDADLIKVMGIKRFRTFGMLKYLKTHFID